MSDIVKVGIIIATAIGGARVASACERCATGRALSIYAGKEVELVGYTTCDGCPGGNVEYAGAEMVKNGAQVIHLATGLVVGYPPCPYIQTFKDFLEARYRRAGGGGHPSHPHEVPGHAHARGTWDDPVWEPLIAPTMADEATRAAYD